ncbi:MAG TPA: DinB family protein [Gemmatimonadaceae bacterium]|nr:DinB family protein [Gemmatimonadaceae bacterium]
MSIGASLVPEFDQETTTTRRVLERVPSDKGDWKPHPKSFSLAHMALLVAGMPGWLPGMLCKPELDLAASPPYTNESTPTLLEMFDRGVRDGRDALTTAKDADFAEEWRLKHGDRVLVTMPRSAVVRQHFSHMVHHRAQLGVYLRLLDIPVPAMYGPTADEGW